ncbi:MAG: helix-turn-helix domain-containing protein [Thermodesulfobacteriota bacterium]|nr:helix-turn-helix domain-containing protein [Thermodesulfobacteriota bacterium]
MKNQSSLQNLGFTQYEASCYMALIRDHPVNGSQVSKNSKVARSRVYDVLKGLVAKGYVVEVKQGFYAPLPADELIKRITARFNADIRAFKKEVAEVFQKTNLEFIWTLTGYDGVMEKAVEMIKHAEKEIYVRLFPQADDHLKTHLKTAERKNVNIRYIAMGNIPKRFRVQVNHPEQDTLLKTIGGRSFDVICDRKEALTGIFEPGNEDTSPINWTRNKWFVTASRDSLRHDFYHCFLQKTYDDNEKLTKEEQDIYEIIKKDN